MGKISLYLEFGWRVKILPKKWEIVAQTTTMEGELNIM